MTLLKKVMKLFPGDLRRVYFSFKNDLGFDSLPSCWDFQQGQGCTCNSTRWAMHHQALPSPWLHTTLPQLCTTFLLMLQCQSHLDSRLRRHNTIWFKKQKQVQRRGFATAAFTALPKKVCLLHMNSSQWHPAAFMTYPHLMWLTDTINSSHPCLWEMLIMKTHQWFVLLTRWMPLWLLKTNGRSQGLKEQLSQRNTPANKHAGGLQVWFVRRYKVLTLTTNWTDYKERLDSLLCHLKW